MGKSDLIWDSMLDSYLAGTPYLLRIYFDGKQGMLLGYINGI